MQYLNADAENVVLMEDATTSVFVAVGEYFSSDYTPDHFQSNSIRDGRMMRIVLKACTHPQVFLPYPVVDSDGNVVCRTLGEAFQRRLPMWWMERDAIATCADGTTHSP
jgi:hypothetical protein